MSRLNNDVVGAQSALTGTFVNIITNVVTVIATLTIMFIAGMALDPVEYCHCTSVYLADPAGRPEIARNPASEPGFECQDELPDAGNAEYQRGIVGETVWPAN